MFRRSTNNPWIPPSGLNGGYFVTPGGAESDPGAGSRFPGLLGQTVVHSSATALKDSNTAVGTLFEGVYQLVKFSTSVVGTTGFAGTVKRGSLVFWDTLANNGLNAFTVTDVAAANADFRAGIVINADTVIANVAGQFGYIQVAGLANCLFGTVAGGVIGQLIVQDTLTSTVFNSLTDATQFPAATAASDFKRGPLGLSYELQATGTVSRVLLRLDGWHYNIG